MPSRSVDQLVEQAERFRPGLVAIGEPTLAAELAARVPSGTEVVAGPDGLRRPRRPPRWW